MREPLIGRPASLRASADLLHHVLRHRRVDLVGGVDELRGVAVLAQAPGEEVGDHRDAISAEARAGIVREEGERLRARGVDHLPDGDPEPVAHHGELVRQRDVDRAEGVLVELGRLCDRRARHRHHGVHDLRVDRLGAAAALLRHAGHELGGGAHRPGLVAGVDALGRVPEEEVLADLAAVRLEDGEQDLQRGAGIGRGLQDHELAVAELLRHRLGRADHERDVWCARLRERGRDADREGIELDTAL